MPDDPRPYDSASDQARPQPSQPEGSRAERPAPPSPERASGGRGCLWAILGVIFLCFWTVVVLVIGIAAGGAATGLSAGAAHALPVKVLDKGDGIGASTVALIPVSGAIMGGGTHLEGEGTIHTVARKLNAARNNADVRAVILQVSSPGGSLTASDLLYHEVRRLKASGKTVIVMIGDLAASGGYYVAAPADYIVASPTSLVGSIGVIWYRFQVSELMERIGVKPEPIESVEMKDFMSPFRDLTPEEREHARELLATAHDRFVEIIVEGRGLPEATVRSLADGRIYTAGDALDLGLVDEIGYIDAAIEKAREIEGLTHRPRIIAYGEPFELEDLFRLRGGRGLDAGRLLRAAEEAARPRRAAIWTGSSGE